MQMCRFCDLEVVIILSFPKQTTRLGAFAYSLSLSLSAIFFIGNLMMLPFLQRLPVQELGTFEESFPLPSILQRRLEIYEEIKSRFI